MNPDEVPNFPSQLINGRTQFVSEVDKGAQSQKDENSIPTNATAKTHSKKDGEFASFSAENKARTKTEIDEGMRLSEANLPEDSAQVIEQTVPSRSPVVYDKKYIMNVFGKETKCICAFLNNLLLLCPLVKDYLPLDESNLLERLSDGVLLCAIANALEPNLVDEVAVFTGPMLKSSAGRRYDWLNMNLGLMSLQMLGVYIETIETTWFGDQGSTMYAPGILLQIVRLASLKSANLRDNDKLLYTHNGWTDENEVARIKGLPRDQLLMRWVNYQLEKLGVDLRMSDFGASLADSAVYAQLLKAVGSKKASLIPVETIMAEANQTKRAELVLKNATSLGIPNVILPEHIVRAGEGATPSASLTSELVYTLNLAFISQILSKYPNIDIPKDKVNKKVLGAIKKSYKAGSVEETMVMWLNSFGPSSPVVFLDTDLRNGLTLLQVASTQFPNCVDWSKVNFNPRTSSSYVENCSILLESLKSRIRTNSSAINLASGKSRDTTGLVFALMQSQMSHTGSAVSFSDNDSHVLRWFNEKMGAFGSEFKLNDINDASLRNTTALGFFSERVLAEKIPARGLDWKPLVRQPSLNVRARVKIAADKAKKAVKALDEKARRRMRAVRPSPNKPESESTCSAVSAVSEASEASGTEAWTFETVASLSGKELDKYSDDVICLLRQGGIAVFSSKLGPTTHPWVYKSVLFSLNS